jgi:hypothetical protein
VTIHTGQTVSVGTPPELLPVSREHSRDAQPPSWRTLSGPSRQSPRCFTSEVELLSTSRVESCKSCLQNHNISPRTRFCKISRRGKPTGASSRSGCPEVCPRARRVSKWLLCWRKSFEPAPKPASPVPGIRRRRLFERGLESSGCLKRHTEREWLASVCRTHHRCPVSRASL